MALRTVAVRLVSHVQPYVAGMRRAQVATQQTAAQAATLGTGIKRAGTSMGNVAMQAGLLRGGLVNPLTATAAAAAGATKAAIDWESAWAGVQKTVDGSSEQMERLQGDLRDMTGELPASHAEIAGVAEAAGQLGVKVDDVADFTRTMIDLGESTNLSARDAAVGLARFTNIMGTAREDTRRLGSSLVELGNNTATTEGEILELATRLAAAAEIIGLSEAETLAFAATMSSVGVEAQAGGTALSKVFQTVRDSVIDGSEELQVFADVADTTADEFARRFREDPAGAIAEFIAGLGRMNEAGESTSEVFADLGLQDQRLMRALLSTAEAGDLLTDSIELASDAWEENVALTEEAGRRYDTDSAKIEMAWNRIKDAAIDFGAAVAPVVAGAAEGIADLLDLLETADQKIKTFGEEALPEDQIPTEDLLGMFGEAFMEGRAFSGTIERMQEYSDSAHAATGATKQLAIRGAEARDRAREVGEAADGAKGPIGEMAGATGDAATEAERAAEHLSDYLDEMRAATDPVFALLDAVQQVDEAQRNYNEAVDKYSKDSPEAEAASIALGEAIAGAEAAAINGDLSFEEFERRLQSWEERNLISAEAADVLRDSVKGAREQGEILDDDYEMTLLLENFRDVTSKLDGVERRAIEATRQRTLHLSTSGAVAAARAAWNVANAVSNIPSFKRVTIGYSVTGRPAGVVHSGGEVMPGGSIRKFHSGGPVLGSDEVPAILQTGEVVLSRQQVDLLSRALAPVAPRAMPSFHGGGMATGGGVPSLKVVISGSGTAGQAEADRINYLLRQGELNIRAEAMTE